MDLADDSQHVLEVRLQGTLQLDDGAVPAVWVELPAELAGERGQFEVERREGHGTDVFGVRFAAGTAWIALPSSVAEDARRAGKLAVFVEPEPREDAPYFTIDFYEDAPERVAHA